MNRIDYYTRQLRTDWRWPAIEQECSREHAEPNDDGDGRIARAWLGTWTALSPSGCIYTPWACSNVAGDCPACDGTGERQRNGADTAYSCPVCYGYGSRSAARDEDWREALETVADEHGLFVDEYDGSVFVAACYDEEEEECTRDDERVGATP